MGRHRGDISALGGGILGIVAGRAEWFTPRQQDVLFWIGTTLILCAGCHFAWSLIRGDTIQVPLFSGNQPGKDFTHDGCDWTPVRVWVNGIDDHMEVSGPKCREMAGGALCGRVQIPTNVAAIYITCPNTLCPRRNKMLPRAFNFFVESARQEANARSANRQLEMDPIPTEFRVLSDP